MLCRIGPAASKGGSKAGVRGASDFAGLATAYGLALSAPEQRALVSLPSLPVARVATVLVATEAKAAMTAGPKSWC